jgi:hypothetical protein
VVKKPDVARTFFNCTCIVALFVAGTVYGAFDERASYALFHVRNAVAAVYQETDTLLGLEPVHYLQPARHSGDGVTVNAVKVDEDLVLMTGFFGDANELRLIRRDGEILARWPAHFTQLFPDTGHLKEPPATDWNIDLHGAVMLPDGSVIFNFDYGGLVKMDRCGKVLWTLNHPTHHSVERAEEGGFWVPGRRFHDTPGNSPFPPFEPPFSEDTIMRVSDDGEILSELSVPDLLYENGLEALLTATGHSFDAGMFWDNELVHLNKIDELSSDIADDFPMFDAGDLLISLRTLNTILVVDPDTAKVKWWRTGPWVRQHDPEFKAGGTIVLFNNNTYRSIFGWQPGGEVTLLDRTSNIIEVDPVNGDHRVLYGDEDGQSFFTVIRGKLQLTRRGGLMITEFEGGRAFEVDPAGRVVWEYINRYDETRITELTEARLYSADHFEVSDWSCEDPTS